MPFLYACLYSGWWLSASTVKGGEDIRQYYYVTSRLFFKGFTADFHIDTDTILISRAAMLNYVADFPDRTYKKLYEYGAIAFNSKGVLCKKSPYKTFKNP